MLEFLLPPGLLEGDPPTWYAVVRPSELRAPAYDGVPRAAAPDAEPRVLILDGVSDGPVFVSRYDATLGYLTDVGYPDRESALEDCAAEFGEALGPWLPVPIAESSPESYVLRQVSHTAPRSL